MPPPAAYDPEADHAELVRHLRYHGHQRVAPGWYYNPATRHLGQLVHEAGQWAVVCRWFESTKLMREYLKTQPLNDV
jgi:hypothetical protein